MGCATTLKNGKTGGFEEDARNLSQKKKKEWESPLQGVLEDQNW